MFLRKWPGLPQDVSFPADLRKLGYFINDEDEIRLIEKPDLYFNFFLNRNERINACQRFAFTRAVEDIVHQRLEDEGLEKCLLPLGTSPQNPHVPIFASRDIASRSRVIVIFGETTQPLGILALRIANGRGGISKGSMVSVVQALRLQPMTALDRSTPGIVIANMGQRYWWPKDGGRCLTVQASQAVRRPSLVHLGWKHAPSVHQVPGNENPARHIEHIFDEVLTKIVGKSAKIDIIAISESCELVETFLDVQDNWKIWGPRLNAMLLLGSVYSTTSLTNENFKRFLARRTRGYLVSHKPIDTLLAPPSGNLDECIPPLGCPCYSSSEPCYEELILIRALQPTLGYLAKMSKVPASFGNADIVVGEREAESLSEAVSWDDVGQSRGQ